MKEYRTNEELIDYLESKGVSIPNKKDAIEKIERSILFMKNGGQIQVPVRWVKKMREIVLQHQKCFN